MIKAKLLNSEASLNDYFYLESIEFVPGEDLTIAIQLFDAQRDIRLIPPVAAELTMSFIDSDGNDVVKTGALIDPDDRSMRVVTLSQAETEVLAGQNIIVTLDANGDASLIEKAFMANVVIRTNLSGDC